MIAWAIETLIASTLLMAAVLLLRKPVRQAFGPHVAYALWALPGLRMLLPPLPETWRGAALPVVPPAEDIIVYLGEPIATLPAEPAHGIGWPSVLLALWLAGAAAFALFHLIKHERFCARVRRLARSVKRVADGRVEVIETDAATGPLAFGVWRKYVAFPRDFAERYDPLERDLALAHELGHHVRGDLIANWAALIMLSVHWFNPVAWRAFRAFRADQEMACDALVLSGRAAGLRHAYGRAIVKSAHGGAVSAACHLHTINELKGRLRMLNLHERQSRKRLLAGAGAIAALTLTGLGVTASGTQAAERVRSSVETATGVDLADIELPTLPQDVPTPPSPPAEVAPPAAVAPPAPPAPGAAPHKRHRVIVIRDKDGKVETVNVDDGDDHPIRSDEIRKHRFVFRGKDGKVTTWNGMGPMPPMPPMPPEAFAKLKNMPEISSRDCRSGEGKAEENVIRTRDGTKRRIIICINRIARASEAAAAAHAEAAARAAEASVRHVDTAKIEREAVASALEGLRHARARIQGNRSMTDSQRAEALSGIDEAIREMESERRN
jgi:bla regulator protein BlaR1